jgi:hypothetical protein
LDRLAYLVRIKPRRSPADLGIMSARFNIAVLLSALLALTGACGKKSNDTKPLPKGDGADASDKHDDKRSIKGAKDEPSDDDDDGEDDGAATSDDDDDEATDGGATKIDKPVGDDEADDEGGSEQVIKSDEPPVIPVQRFVHPVSGDHFYTTYEADFPILTGAGYTNEGIGFYSVSPLGTGAVPMYRWYSSVSGDHFYTTTDVATIPNYQKEGIAFYVRGAAADGFVPLNRYLRGAFHFYTVDTTVPGWTSEGTEGFVKTAP